MPLTVEEQRELAELDQLAGESPQIGLTVAEQQELVELDRLAAQSQIDEQRVSQLLEQLGGRLPGRDPIPVAAFPGPAEEQRRRAFQELTQRGFTPEQLRLSVQAQKILGGARAGRGAGGLVGALGATAIAGRAIPGPIDDAAILTGLIAAGGAGFGGIAGEAIQTGIEEKRLIGKREALKAFAIEAGTELGGRGIVRAGKFVAGPLIKRTVPEAAALVDDFAKVGGQFSPTELDRRFTLRIGEAFSRGSFGAKEIFQEFEERQGKAVLAFADSIIDAISDGIARQTPEEIGEMFAAGITKPSGRIFTLLDDLFKPLYSQLDDLTKTAGVSTKSLKVFRAKTVAQNQRLIKEALRTGKELPLVSAAGKQILDDIDNLPDVLMHGDYRAFRTKALKDVRKLSRDVDVSEGLVKEVSNITRKELLDPKSVAGASQEARRLHANISNLYAASQKGLETTLSERLATRLLKNPSRIVKEVFPNNNPKAIRLLRQSLIEPISGKPSAEGKILWNQLRQAWLADAVSEATKEGVAKPKVYNNLIRKLGKGFEEMFPEREIANNVKRIQTIFETAGKAPPTGASLFSRGAQVGGLALMYKSGKEGDIIGFTAGSVLAIGPLAFAKLATNPKGVKLLTAGFRLKPGASGLVPNAVRMVRLLREMNKKENRQRLTALKLEQQRLRRRPIVPPTFQQLRGFGGRGF